MPSGGIKLVLRIISNIPKGGTDKTDRRLLFLIAVIHEIRVPN